MCEAVPRLTIYVCTERRMARLTVPTDKRRCYYILYVCTTMLPCSFSCGFFSLASRFLRVACQRRNLDFKQEHTHSGAGCWLLCVSFKMPGLVVLAIGPRLGC